jgi:signal transduction histidine kinase
MDMITIAAAAAHAAIFAIIMTRQIIQPSVRLWLGAGVLLSLFAVTTYLLPEDFTLVDQIGRGFVLAALLIGSLAAYGGLTLRDLSAPEARVQRQRYWLGLTGVWFVALLIAALVGETAVVGTEEWLIDLFRSPDATTILMPIGLILSGGGIIGFAFYMFYKARLPEIANRALFWVIALLALVLGIAMTVSGSDVIAALGILLLLSAHAGATYALSFHHIFDIRSAMVLAVRTVTFILIASVFVFLILFVVLRSDLRDDPEGLLTLGLLALIAAAAYIPLRQGIDATARQITARGRIDPTYVTREYSRLIAEVTELEALIPSVTSTLNEVLRVRTSCIMLLNETSNQGIGLLIMSPGTPLDRTKGNIKLESPLYSWLARDRKPLLQFDIEFSPHFVGIDDEERQFFRGLGMSAYAPITLDYTMIGVLAVGQKLNDTAFYPRDLSLLETLAQQTGVALRNSRLVDDLQHLNKSMRTLNMKLKSTNEQLQTMDKVKSDFVTIASHELRTPLAQVRGYTDIVDALNEQGILDQDQTNNLVSNLRKATERMEELISAMLDVSQLDVDAMDLRFTQTSVEAVTRMAIEPLTDAIRQRKLTLSARGLRGLPNIQADLQRIVQAFRNVIVNAIKFTPDGGKIEITASLQESDEEGDHILVSIQDTGVGIDRANLEMIFKKFFRAYDPSLHSTGTYKFLGAGPGLGLTIARGVIEGHGGRIWAESTAHDMEARPGSTFHILLPVTMPEDAEKRVVSFEGPAASAAVSQPPAMRRETERKRPQPVAESQSADDSGGETS